MNPLPFRTVPTIPAALDPCGPGAPDPHDQTDVPR